MINIKDQKNTFKTKTDELILGVLEGTNVKEHFSTIDKTFSGGLDDLINQVQGTCKEINSFYTLGQLPAQKITFAGLGKEDEQTYTSVRNNFAALFKHIHASKKSKEISIYADKQSNLSTTDYIKSVTEAFYLSTYNYEGYKTTKTKQGIITSVTIFVEENDISEAKDALKYATAVSLGMNNARDLMNRPANKCTPTILKDEIVSIAKKHDMKYEVIDKKNMEELGMGGMLGVTQGSVEEPYIAVVTYTGDPDSDEVLGLIGKGVTFDTGGISLKSKQGLEILKKDMGGGATMAGVMDTIGRLQPKVNITAVIGCVENMPSGSAYKPGDVITMMNTMTVEIISTDAEGRLVLGDCITYAKTLGVTKLIDCATLTGAVRMALGWVAAGVMGNDEEMIQSFLHSAEAAGERAWQLPMFPEYRRYLDSPVADMKNSASGTGGGSQIAGKFLEEFVEDTPWVHLDISSSGWTHSPNELMEYGATAAMVRTITHYALKDE